MSKRRVSTGVSRQTYSNRRKKAVVSGVAGATVLGGAYALTRGDNSGGGSSSKKSSDVGSNAPTDTGEDTGENTGENTGDGSSSGGSNLKSKVTEVPIDNYKDALDFANREWNKIKRENGHTLECQVQGSCNWKVGEWCKVYMPSFDIDDYMYIVRVSQSSEGGEWSSNLSLMDYPPGWGKEELKKEEDENSEEDSTDGGDGTDSSDGSSSDNGGDGTDSSDGSSSTNTEEGDGRTDMGNGMRMYES